MAFGRHIVNYNLSKIIKILESLEILSENLVRLQLILEETNEYIEVYLTELDSQFVIDLIYQIYECIWPLIEQIQMTPDLYVNLFILFYGIDDTNILKRLLNLKLPLIDEKLSYNVYDNWLNTTELSFQVSKNSGLKLLNHILPVFQKKHYNQIKNQLKYDRSNEVITDVGKFNWTLAHYRLILALNYEKIQEILNYERHISRELNYHKSIRLLVHSKSHDYSNVENKIEITDKIDIIFDKIAFILRSIIKEDEYINLKLFFKSINEIDKVLKNGYFGILFIRELLNKLTISSRSHKLTELKEFDLWLSNNTKIVTREDGPFEIISKKMPSIMSIDKN